MIRTGRKNGHTIYRIVNDEPSDDDQFLGAFGDPEVAAEIVDNYNGYYEAWQRIHLLETHLAEERKLHEYHKAEHAKYVQNPILTPEAKADTEAAFQRGVEHAQGNMGVSRYAMNRDGIMRVGSAAAGVSQAKQALEDAERELTKAVTLLSEDPEPAEQELGYPANPFTASVDGEPLAVTPEAVAATAPDEADDEVPA